jgi:hypothetical protein
MTLLDFLLCSSSFDLLGVFLCFFAFLLLCLQKAKNCLVLIGYVWMCNARYVGLRLRAKQIERLYFVHTLL